MQSSIWLPPAAAFVISFFTSMGGISGAFLLLPLQMSVLGITSPAVSATNLVFNLVATPGGVYRYAREKRIIWPLALLVVAGTTPGMVLGGFVRLSYLSDVKRFKIFVGLVLLWLGIRLALDIWKSRNTASAPSKAAEWHSRTAEFNWRRLVFEFRHQRYECKPTGVFVLSLIVGLIGGIYGIGGASIISPFLVAIYGLPVYTVAGATLLGTFVTSLAGVSFYQIVAPVYQASGMTVAPNWSLGLSFGVGGMAGMYLGARVQRFIPATYLKILLALVIFGVSAYYIAAVTRNNVRGGPLAVPSLHGLFRDVQDVATTVVGDLKLQELINR